MQLFTRPGAICLLLAAQLLLTACDPAVEYPVQTTPATGGEGTVEQADHNAYSLPQSNLPMTSRLDFSVGNSFFRNPWVIAPSSTDARDGLGPLFNTNSCQGCHIKDGRGHPPARDETAVSLFLRLSVPADAAADALILEQHGFLPAPVYGSQLQTAAIPGMRPEANLIIEWAEREETLADGTSVSLRKPTYRIENPAYGPLPANLLVSPRVAPAMIGLGLLEAIPEADILAAVDPVWGIGLAQQINSRAGFLHDGRAATLQQAILWHGGEAEHAVAHYRQLSSEHRGALILFLESL